jgi:hypothetical protein
MKTLALGLLLSVSLLSATGCHWHRRHWRNYHDQTYNSERNIDRVSQTRAAS